MYLEGSDQHRGWFQSSLLLSLAGNGAAPYRTVLTHGFMVDEDREKISKSNQSGYQKPQTSEAYIKKYGVDVVRLWVASQDFRNDIVVSDKRIEKVGETYRIIRNALRYQLSNLYDFDPSRDAVEDGALTELDRWILDEFSSLETDVVGAYEDYNFHVVYQRVSQFVAVELSSIYHDIVKDRLYTDAAKAPRRRSTQTALYRMVKSLCSLLSPVLVFTADEACEYIPGMSNASTHELTWTPLGMVAGEEERRTWKEVFTLRETALPELEKARQAKTIGKALEARLVFTGVDPILKQAEKHREFLRELLNVSQLEVSAGGESGIAVKVDKAEGTKCERCWHWEKDVGSDPQHPTLCGRCAKAVTI